MMKVSASVIALTVILNVAQGHWMWPRLALNDEWLEPTRYIRNITSPVSGESKLPPDVIGVDPLLIIRDAIYPTYYWDKPESVRCGRGTLDHAASTEVLKVKAGDTLEFAHARAPPEEWSNPKYSVLWNCTTGYGSCSYYGGQEHYTEFNHFGPVSVHLSKVPDGQDVTTYDGSGEWTKIHTVGLDVKGGELHWIMFNNAQQPPRAPFKIPSQTPAGQYLLRIEGIWTGSHHTNEFMPQEPSQIYPGCAQIEVESTFKGPLPSPGVKIPEIFVHGQPGTVYSNEMGDLKKLDDDYVYPGGPLWDGEKLYQDRPIPH